ncbi:acyl-CoA carboxylase epsilon subunit [Streptomyces sp. Ru73]|uniref:acyl-CoA carboxylase epsilon subunit n=1 Tax=Streptomyces sp. Ru73 TaxID=2080748 RepID=UPI0021566A36|nr:acyl-CoA carboxylase epsilon subunit [Streptomyces sp. Ru73]
MNLWRIVSGSPRAEETAALTVVLTAFLAERAAAAAAAASEEPIRSAGWHRAHRNPHRPPGTWRSR